MQIAPAAVPSSTALHGMEALINIKRQRQLVVLVVLPGVHSA